MIDALSSLEKKAARSGAAPGVCCNLPDRESKSYTAEYVFLFVRGAFGGRPVARTRT
ncbi:MAG: hypothetical protein LUG50_07075 [Planctomycetaceae bacterium]|nr:hypothetical protein [Planctomycetaceae bacterium]